MTTKSKPPVPPSPSPRPPLPEELDTATLFGAAREVVIRHGSERYRLRITQAGKLILTK